MATGEISKLKKSLFVRPLFKRPVAATKSRADVDGTDLFSRSNSSYQAVVEEEEERLERRAARIARKSKELSIGKASLPEIGNKRRRISISSSTSSTERDSESESRSSQTRSSPYSPPQSKVLLQPERLSKRSNTGPSTRNQTIGNSLSDKDSQETIGAFKLSGEEGNNIMPTSISFRPEPPTPSTEDIAEDEEEEAESDDELAELARQARAAAARKKQEASQSTPGDYTHSLQRGNSLSVGDNSQSHAKAKGLAVFVEVQSPLPGAETYRFKTPLDKRIRDIRLRWCIQNEYSDVEAREIILVFRGERVFDVNTPDSLGISIDNEGSVNVKGDDSMNPVEDGIIVMEAIKEDDLERYSETWTEAQGLNKSSYHDDSEDEPEPPAPQIQPEQKSIKIICQAKDLSDFKLLVKGSTTIARIQWAFIMQHSLSDDAEIVITFDGETLAPDTTMLDLGVDDMDMFDVQVR